MFLSRKQKKMNTVSLSVGLSALFFLFALFGLLTSLHKYYLDNKENVQANAAVISKQLDLMITRATSELLAIKSKEDEYDTFCSSRLCSHDYLYFLKTSTPDIHIISFSDETRIFPSSS